jgi:hypothetical protein
MAIEIVPLLQGRLLGLKHHLLAKGQGGENRMLARGGWIGSEAAAQFVAAAAYKSGQINAAKTGLAVGRW